MYVWQDITCAAWRMQNYDITVVINWQTVLFFLLLILMEKFLLVTIFLWLHFIIYLIRLHDYDYRLPLLVFIIIIIIIIEWNKYFFYSFRITSNIN